MTTELTEPKAIDTLEKLLIKDRKVLLDQYEVSRIEDDKSVTLVLAYSPVKKIDEKKLFRIFN
jgi:hypothetical protein